MSSRSLGLSDKLQDYLFENVVHEPEVLLRLRRETSQLSVGAMQISPEQGRFMAWLIALSSARRCLEIGVFTGYSSLSVALALPDDGRLIACDVSEDWTRIARRYWKEAGVEHKIELRLGPARDTLSRLLDDGQAGSFDFAFIDADKEQHEEYFERCLELLKKGGVIAVDNALWSGRVADPNANDSSTSAIRALNARAAADARVDTCLVPIGDGLLLSRKK